MSSFVKKPCAHCPYRKDVRPFLHPKRAAEIAMLAQDVRWSFSCHKTTEYDERLDMQVVTASSQECAGMLTLRAQVGQDIPEGFLPAWDLVYQNPDQMIKAYQDLWAK